MIGSADLTLERPSALAGELRVLIGRLYRRLREQSHLGDFTLAEINVLKHLESEGAQTVSGLARALNVRPQSMGATVAALKAQRLIAGEPDPSDGRQTVLSLTPYCREAIAASRAAREDWLAQTIQAKLTPAEQTTLRDGLALLGRLVEA